MLQQLLDHLSYASYRTQRDGGVSAGICAKWYPNASSLEKQYTKGPTLFVTEDKVEIKKGDEYWMVYEDLSFWKWDTNYKWPQGKFKTFSTEEAAGKFIIDCLANNTF